MKGQKRVRLTLDRSNLSVGMPHIVIPVSSRVIERAVQKDSHKCMIADALHKRIPGAVFISVDLQSIRFTDPATQTRYKYFTPLPAQQSLVNFDLGKPVKPFTITLKDGVRENVKKESKRKRSAEAKSGKKRAPRNRAKERPRLVKKMRKFGLRNLE